MKTDEKPKKKDNKIMYLAIALIVIIITVLLVLSNPNIMLSSYQKYYAGGVRNFRANLDIATDVPVLPNEKALLDVLLNPDVYQINIAFFPNETENSFYFATSFEISNKLTIIYSNIIGSQITPFETEDGSTCIMFQPSRAIKCFRSLPINSTDDLLPTPIEPVILLLGPSQSNKTAVTVERSLITLEGESFEEIDRDYTDLDLATDKMLLVLMDYTSS